MRDAPLTDLWRWDEAKQTHLYKKNKNPEAQNESERAAAWFPFRIISSFRLNSSL